MTMPVPDHIRLCEACGAPAAYAVACRHGAEFPACQRHIQQALTQAFEQDGDHGVVSVYHIGLFYEHNREYRSTSEIPR